MNIWRDSFSEFCGILTQLLYFCCLCLNRKYPRIEAGEIIATEVSVLSRCPLSWG